MTDQNIKDEELFSKFLEQTSRLSWKELEPYYASDIVWSVDKGIDLIEVACVLAKDDSNRLNELMKSSQVVKLDHGLARRWMENEGKTIDLWAVVVAPWVLIQEREIKVDK